MADPKDTDAPGGTPGRRPQAAAGPETPAAGRSGPRREGDGAPAEAGTAAPGGAGGPGGTVKTRETQYLIAPRVFAGGLRPFSTDQLESHLNTLEGVSIVRRITPAGVGAFALGDGGVQGSVLVARTTPERGQELEMASRQGAPVIVERDLVLNHHGLAPLETTGAIGAATATGAIPSLFSAGQMELRFRVVGAEGQPLPRCQITVYGRNFPGQGVTDDKGEAAVTLFGEAPSTITAMYVKPFADHWERYIERPQLATDGGPNLIELKPLSALLPRFPQQQMLGWGQELMGLGQVPPHLNGQGVKVAIIDSGCDVTHPQLTHIGQGVDLTNAGDADGWKRDEISHGTHCAGVIAGLANDNQGIRGFAPGAEVLVLKVFPGGRFSNLIDAIDLCLERGIDVVNCSLGSSQVSEIVQRKLEEARQRGLAVIVAAGNSAGPVQFPATLPDVLSVAAIGQEKRFPPDSYHARAEVANTVGVNGAFPAKFSCFGPQIKVSGPGVAIVSTVPGGGYAAWDGTSMAAPHLTGLAALVLAHHPLFQGQLRTRSAQRVDALFQTIMAAATPVVADRQRGGVGLPLVAPALGGATQAGAPGVAAGGGMPLGQAIGSLAGVPLGGLLGQGLGGGFGGLGGFAAAFQSQRPAMQPGFGMQTGFPQDGLGGAGGLPQGAEAFGGAGMPQVLMQLRQLGLL